MVCTRLHAVYLSVGVGDSSQRIEEMVEKKKWNAPFSVMMVMMIMTTMMMMMVAVVVIIFIIIIITHVTLHDLNLLTYPLV